MGSRQARGVLSAAVIIVLGAGLWVGIAGRSVKHHGQGPPAVVAPSAAQPALPAGPVSLDGWKLSIPVVGDDGDATTVAPAQERGPWLTRTADGGLAFWAPTHGVTTKHSDHPRTELDSLTTFTAGQGHHLLVASVTLQQQPADGRGIILGQIHGADDISAIPYVMLRWQQNQVRVVVKQDFGDALINYPLLDDVKVGDTFSYSITDSGDGSVTFTGTQNGVTRRSVAPVPAAFSGATVRFQAGDYQQANTPGGAGDGGRVTFHGLSQQP